MGDKSLTFYYPSYIASLIKVPEKHNMRKVVFKYPVKILFYFLQIGLLCPVLGRLFFSWQNQQELAGG